MRVAVVGTGFGERVLGTVFRNLGCEVEILSPRDRDGIARTFASDVDLVSIHSPPFLHFEHVMLALDHGRNVLCAKPFGRSAAESRAMRDRAQSLGVLNFLNFEYRRHPSRAKAKALMEAGAIGALKHISWTFLGAGLRHQTHRWLFERERSGGWIGAWGLHAIDTMRFWFGEEIARCGGLMRTETRFHLDGQGHPQPATAEDAISAWFVMERGATVSLDTGFGESVNFPSRIHLMGTEGAIEIVGELTLTLHRPGVEPEAFSWQPAEGDGHNTAMIPWLTEVKAAVERGRQINPSFDDGVAVAEVMDSLYAGLLPVGLVR